ncbi:FtsX-like permease family protein [Streptomyces sp. NBC_00091]|uniref:FtsX-like permease family protein n=1 Tax=Streptomyces sp. NBC_00091 TaxID=2975648 RepID=UPI002255C695|nr:FtsX-like permease family protein [Streptomyces sp. NBC_00091]MCX5380028.1 ABC transporter permease [Streptomyces sp. NBC_00091]
MIGFVVRRLRGRLPLAAAVLLAALITTTTLTALLAFTRGVGDAGVRQALANPAGRSNTAVVLSGEHPVAARSGDDTAVRGFADGLFGSVPVGVESLARSRSYGLPGTRAPGKEPDLTLLAALDPGRVRLLAGQWPEAVGDRPGRVPVAVPQAALNRLGLTGQPLPAEVRLEDRYGGAPLTVLVTGVYRAAEPDAPYWQLDPLGGREVQVGSFTSYGPLLVHDSAFTAGALVQNSRATLLTPDFRSARASDVARIRPLAPETNTKGPSGLTVTTGLRDFLGALETGQRVARSTLLVGALQLAVLAGAALLLVAHLLTERQEPERILLTARGASRRRLGALSAAEALLLALPSAVLAPLLTPPLLRLTGRYGPLAEAPVETGEAWLLWPVAAGCALSCVLLTTLPALLRGATAAVLRRAGRRAAVVSGAARSGLDLAVVALAVLAYRQLDRYSGSGAGAGGELGVDPVLVAAPTLALCAGTLLVLRLLPFAARLGGRIAARGRGLGPALVGWQLARRPGRATGPVLLLVLSVSSGILALGQHTAWSASQRDQAEFATAGGLRITGSEVAAAGRGGRYAALPGGDRMIPVVRSAHGLPGGTTGELLALDAAAVARRVPLRADLRDGKPMEKLFAPLAADAPGSAGIVLPGRPQRIDLEVSLRASGASGGARLGVLLRDRFGLTYRAPMQTLPENGEGTLSVDVAALAGAPLGAAAEPLSIAGLTLSYGAGTGWLNRPDGRSAVDAEVALRRVSVTETAGGPAVPVQAAAPAWNLVAPVLGTDTPAARLLPADGALLRLRYTGAPMNSYDLSLSAGGPAAAELPGIATRAYLTAVGAEVGDRIPVLLGSATVPVRVTAAVGALPASGDRAVAVDLATAGRLLAATDGQALPGADEWWLPAASASDPAPARAAAELRAGAGSHRVLLREEVAAGLLNDPLSAGPRIALAALALSSAVLAAIGFAASSAAAARQRGRESAVLLALGAPRRGLARAAAAEGLVLVALGTGVGLAVGAAIVHLTVPLMVLTPAAQRPVPAVLVDLPNLRTLLLAAVIAAVPLLSAVLGGRGDRTSRGAAARLRHVEEI